MSTEYSLLIQCEPLNGKYMVPTPVSFRPTHFVVIGFFFTLIYRETDVKGQTSLSKCKMYDVNWTTIQSWDYENWNSTRYHEKLRVLGKHWQVTKLNKRTETTEIRTETTYTKKKK